MKKNDAMGWIVYILMLGVAAGVGFGMLRPALTSEYASALPINGILLVVLAVFGAIILAAILLELGHIIGAKVGRYEITKVNILGFQFKKAKDKKFHFGFAFSFDGITGETAMTPKDVKTSNPRPSIYFPLIFLLLEAAACVALISLGMAKRGDQGAWHTAYVVGLVVLVIVGLINLYNIFPAALDSKNDGYLMTILNSKTNVEAYNNLLVAQEKMLLGEPAPDVPVYQEVTDFTNSLNQVSIYKALAEKDYVKALEINELTIRCKDKVSGRVYNTAMAQKLSIKLLKEDFETTKQFYIDLPLEVKKFIADLTTAPSVRAYLLISGLIDESEGETKAALSRVDKAIKGSGEDKKAVEENLIKESLAKVIAAHPDWDFSDYSIGDKPVQETNEEAPNEENESSK